MNSPAIDRKNPQKLYCQLAGILRGPIEKGEWKVGSRIPTEEQLCREHRVSKSTVRLAVEELVSFGYLSKIQGKGTFVRRRIPEQSICMAIHLNAERAEFSAERRYHIIEDAVASPGLQIADRLRLGRDERCRCLVRLETLDGLPLALEKLHLPLRLCVGEPNGEDATAPLTACVESRCSTRIQRMRENTDAPCVGNPEAALLRLVPGTPVLRLRQIYYKPGDLPVGYAETVRRMDRYERILEFERL